jgi:hypothetical protein
MTDSIAAIEGALSGVARDIGADTAFVSRAIDILAHFKPHLRAHEPATVVESFERTILFYAYACARARVRRAEGNIFAPVQCRLQHWL